MTTPQRKDTAWESTVGEQPEGPRKDSFIVPSERREITQEPSQSEYRPPANRHGIDWIGREQQGGGKVPEDFRWISNPKQDQEDGSAG